ncbi:hypothetical protein [Terrihabitans sp. B22-R8]|uniref:hypothetical protein n=1 Tax=Terrihabitans sp. B22-R8 TaxID=3425128 RepID=UPI00403C5EF9
MFFTSIGRVLAYILFALGAMRTGMGLYVAINGTAADVQRYIGSGTTGEAIDQGLMYLMAGVVLGVITEISRSVSTANAVR